MDSIREKLSAIKKPNIKLKKPNLKLQNINLKNARQSAVFSLVKKEIKNYFSTPLAYIIFGLFAVIVAIFFLTIFKFDQYGSTDLTLLFTSIGLTFAIIVPALTMGSISKEKQNGTIEYLLTQPITEAQFIAGKVISNAVMLVLMLLLTLPITLLVGSWQTLDLGQIIMQYIGSFILGLCLISIGIAVSAFFKNEIVSLLISLVVCVAFVFIGSDMAKLPQELAFLSDKFSLLTHYQSISRGVADLRDILYFIAFILVFLSIAFFLVIKDKFPKGHQYLRYSQIALIFTLIIAIGVGYLGQVINFRVDFTSGKVYTLSSISSKIVNNISDVLNVTLYSSSNLPLQFQAELREVQDLLRDYSSSSAGKVNVVTKYINPDDTVLNSEAQTNGLQELIFAVDTNNSSQQSKGYFGITVKYLDKSETLNITNDIAKDLEYQITKKIKKVTNPNPKKIGFLASGVEYSRSSDFKTFSDELSELFTVEDITLTKDKPEIPKDINAIIIDNPVETLDPAVQTSIKNFFKNGGSIFLMSNPLIISNDTQQPQENVGSLSDLFADYGIRIDKNMVYDLKSSNRVNAGYIVPVRYPLFIIADSTNADISILKDVKNVSLLWGSTITVDQNKSNGAKVYKLLQTSSGGNTQELAGLTINIDAQWSTKDTDGVKTVAVALENTTGGRAVVVGDAKFLSENFGSIVSLNENLAFGIASTEWLAKDDSIAEIKAKTTSAQKLILDSSQATGLHFTGVVVPVLIVIGLASVNFYIRRKKLNKEYKYHNID